jgi:hypothetical protein
MNGMILTLRGLIEAGPAQVPAGGERVDRGSLK